MKKSRFALLAFALAGVILVLLPFLSVRADSDPVITLGGLSRVEKQNLDKLCEDVKAALRKEFNYDKRDKDDDDLIKFLSCELVDAGLSDSNTVNVSINMKRYNKCSQEQKQAIMQVTLSVITDSKISSTNRNKIYNFVSEADTAVSTLVRQLSNDVQADFASAYATFRPFSGTLGWIMGCIALGIFVALAFTVLLDMAYINLPAVQMMLSGYAEKHPGRGIVSVEAVKAVKECASKEGTDYVNPLWVYMRCKTKQFVALGICLLYLVSGKLFTLVAYVVDLFNGFLPD